MDNVSTKEDLLERALLQAEEAKMAWAMLKPSANDQGYYLWSCKGRSLELLEPALRPKEMSKTLLKTMLDETCMGMQMEDILKTSSQCRSDGLKACICA
jgi:hypothetical protein